MVQNEAMQSLHQNNANLDSNPRDNNHFKVGSNMTTNILVVYKR